MNTATEDAPTEVASPEPKTDVETTPKPSTEADSQDHRPKSRDPERARAILRGEKLPEEKTERAEESEHQGETDAEVVARMFDPETGEFIMEEDEAEEQPSAAKATEKPKAKPEAKTKSAEESEDEETHDSEEEEQGKKPEPRKRISVTRGRLGDRDFAIVQLADRENISLEEARERLYGEPVKAKEETPQPARETPQQIQAKINGLLEERKAATKALDVEKATDLTDQIAELRLQMRDTQYVLHQEEQTRVANHQEAVTASAEKAIGLYPDAADENTELYSAIESERLSREKSDPGFFQNKNWPMVLAVEVAAELGVAPVSKKAAAEVKTPEKKPAEKPVATPKKTARPAPPTPAPGTSTAAAKPNQEEALRAELKSAKASKDIDRMKAVMRKIDDLQAAKR